MACCKIASVNRVFDKITLMDSYFHTFAVTSYIVKDIGIPYCTFNNLEQIIIPDKDIVVKDMVYYNNCLLEF